MTRWMVKADHDPCNKRLQVMLGQIAVVAPTVGSYLPRGGPGGHCRYPVAGIPTSAAARQDRVVIRNYAIKGGEAGAHRSGSYLTGPTAPDPLPALGLVR